MDGRMVGRAVFAKYKTYLQLIITADNEEDFKKWEGWVGSRLKT